MTESPAVNRQQTPGHLPRLFTALAVSAVLHLLLLAAARLPQAPFALPPLALEHTIRLQLNADQGALRRHHNSTTRHRSGQRVGPRPARTTKTGSVSRNRTAARRPVTGRPYPTGMTRFPHRHAQRRAPSQRTTRQQGQRPTTTTSAADYSPPGYSLGSADNPYPPYPYLARKHGWKGRVVLRVRVSRSGRPLQVTIARPSGYRVLDRSAQKTIAKWKFRPSRRGGKRTEASILVPVRFVLKQPKR